MTDELAELRGELARLRDRVIELETERDELAEERAEVTLPGAAVTRRGWMKAAAAAAVGGTAIAVAGAQPVAAANGDPIRIGQTTTATARTRADYTGSANGAGFLFQSGSAFDGTVANYPAALAGWTTQGNQPAGVFGYTSVVGGAGVVGQGSAGPGEGTGVYGLGNKYGLEGSGNVAAVNLIPSKIIPPTETTDFHQGGELYVREASDSGLAVELWYCTVGGTPGSWVQLAGPNMDGQFFSVTPYRAYDSRVPVPDPGALASGSSRTIDIRTARDVDTGGVFGVVIPEGARAISYNLTIVNTSGAGFLEIAPSFATEIASSTINWNQPNQVVANGGIVRIGNDGRAKISCGGAGSTDFLVDITGYWA